MPVEEIVVFDSEEEFVVYVESLPIRKEDRERRILQHELAHGRKARELGYRITYGIIKRVSRGVEDYQGFVDVYGEQSDEHVKQILEAPERLSAEDQKMLRGLGI